MGGTAGRTRATVTSSTSKFWTPQQHRDPHGKQLGNLNRLLGSSREPRVHEPSRKISEPPSPHPKRRCNFIHSQQLSPILERLELPYPNGEILSGYEEDVSFIRVRFTTWVKADPNDTLERHVVDVRKAFAESVRRQEVPVQEYFFDGSVPNRSSVQKKAKRLQLESRTSTWKKGRY